MEQCINETMEYREKFGITIKFIVKLLHGYIVTLLFRFTDS